MGQYKNYGFWGSLSLFLGEHFSEMKIQDNFQNYFLGSFLKFIVFGGYLPFFGGTIFINKNLGQF
jgi:hypothetical protein